MSPKIGDTVCFERFYSTADDQLAIGEIIADDCGTLLIDFGNGCDTFESGELHYVGNGVWCADSYVY